MMKIFSLITFLTLAVSKIIIAQNTFNPELYTYMPLQQITSPKDTSYKENKLVVFNMLEKTFDTIENVNYINTAGNNLFSSAQGAYGDILNRKEGENYIFTNVEPADKLPDFPDFPMSAVVKLFITFFNPANNQSTFATCSGIMIEPGFILTGGHCVKSKFDASYAISCIVIPGYNLGSMPYGLTTTTNWYSFTQWTQNGNLDYDIAIMSLANPIGNTTGYLDWGFNADTSFYTSPSNDFYSFGYPGYDPLGNPVFEEGERMYYMKGYMDFWLSPYRMCHNNIGYSGQSGSGVFYQDSANHRIVHGVLSSGNLFPPYFTCHCRLDSLKVQYFKSIISPMSQTETGNLTKQIPMYPNPSHGVFTLDFTEIPYKEINIQIFDVVGRQILLDRIRSNNSKVSLDISSFPNGLYFIKADIDGKIVHGRMYKTD